jgi:hypothetical protein
VDFGKAQVVAIGRARPAASRVPIGGAWRVIHHLITRTIRGTLAMIQISIAYTGIAHMPSPAIAN